MNCQCREIQANDPARHFRGCPLREELDHTREWKIKLAIVAACDTMSESELLAVATFAARLVPRDVLDPVRLIEETADTERPEEGPPPTPWPGASPNKRNDEDPR